MKVSAAAKVGFTAIIIALALIVIYRGLGRDFFGFSRSDSGKYVLHASFESVKGLSSGADVQLNGNPIGEVGEMVNYANGGVGVELLIKNDQPIHKHARFTITRESIFGSYLVSIDESRSGRIVEDESSGNRITIVISAGQVSAGEQVHDANDIKLGYIDSVVNVDTYTDHAVVLLDTTARVTADMAFVPMRPSLISFGGVVVYPKLQDGDSVSGAREAGPEDLVANADIALREITEQTSVIMTQLTSLLSNVEEVLSPEEIRVLVEGITSDITQIANNIISLTDRLNYILSESQPHILGTAENVEGLTSDSRELVQGLSQYNNPEVREDVQAIVANLSEASDALIRILEDVEGYTSDEQMRGDITGSIHEARITIEQAQGTLQNAESALGELSSGIDIFDGINTSAEFTLRNAPEPDRWAGDLNFRISSELSDIFVTGGVDDIGENDQANAQVGWWINDQFTTRVGLNRGKLGLGIDWQTDAYRIMNDVYDLNDLRWDIYAGYGIIPELDLVVGVEDLLDDDEVNLGLAFQF